jgi:archaeal flagellar protein FlaJ
VIEELKKNVDTQIEMLKEISNYVRRLEHSSGQEKKLLEESVKSLRNSMRMINNSLPRLTRDVSSSKKLPSNAENSSRRENNLEKVEFFGSDSKVSVVLSKEDKEKFLKELSISEKLIKKLKKRDSKKKEKSSEFKASRGYLKTANKLFFETATNWVNKGYFKDLSIGLRKANIDILFRSYVALIFLTFFISIIASLFLMIFLLFINVSPLWPFFSFYEGSYLIRFAKLLWIPLVIPLLVFFGLYFYPSSEQKSISKKIDQELPFAVIHMSAISGSGIAPSEIFKIIGLSEEYPTLRKEIRKVLNQINLYGYDLITALSNASKTSPNEKLSDLFSGLSTTITSGANLSDFFEKRAESLLLSYRLERERYTKLVETFLDIYISIVIAAPMIFLLLLIMMMVSGIDVGLSSVQISLIAVFGIAILNVVFIIFLQMRQPSY